MKSPLNVNSEIRLDFLLAVIAAVVGVGFWAGGRDSHDQQQDARLKTLETVATETQKDVRSGNRSTEALLRDLIDRLARVEARLQATGGDLPPLPSEQIWRAYPIEPQPRPGHPPLSTRPLQRQAPEPEPEEEAAE